MLRPRALYSWGAWSVAFGLIGGCTPPPPQTGPVGLHRASIEPLPGIVRPVDESDPAALLARGRLLYRLERAFELARDGLGAATVGPRPLVLADVDPGGRSGQVVVYRPIPKPKRRGPLATRWRRVSLSLEPERILEVSTPEASMPQSALEDLRLRAAVSALDVVAQKTSGPFHAHPLVEQELEGSVRIRVYVFGDVPTQPDLELVFAPHQYRPRVDLLSQREIHPAGARSSAWILTPQHRPSPMTLARVLARAPRAKSVEVRSAGGVTHLSTATATDSPPQPAQ